MTSSRAAVALLGAALLGCGGGVDVTYRRTTNEVRTYLRTLELEGTNPSGVAGRARQEVLAKETAVEVLGGRQATLQVEVKRFVTEVFRGGPEPLLRMDTDVPTDPGAPGKAPETEAEKFAWAVSHYRHVAGSRIEVEQMFTGKILKFSGLEDLRKKVLDAIPEGDQRRPVMERFPWEQWFAYLLAPAIGVPDRGMKEGAENRFVDIRLLPETVGTRGLLYYGGTYRLVKVEQGVARLEMEAEAFLDPLPGMPPWPKEMASRRNFLRLARGVCRAWAKVRVETGVLLEDEHVTELDLHFRRPDGTGEIPIPQKITLRSKLVP